MTTIRRRLTVWYTVALGVTLLAFGTLLYLERRSSSIRELDQRLLLEADLAERWLSESYNVLGRIVTTAGGRPSLDPGISAYLDAVADALESGTGPLACRDRVLPGVALGSLVWQDPQAVSAVEADGVPVHQSR